MGESSFWKVGVESAMRGRSACKIEGLMQSTAATMQLQGTCMRLMKFIKTRVDGCS